MVMSNDGNRYDRIAWLYDLREEPLESRFAGLRRELLSSLEGDVLEVGVGTGRNLPHYPRSVRLTAIDSSPKMLARAVSRARKMEMKAALQLMDVEEMSFPDRTFDYVVSTLVFCSVADPVRGLRQIGRVLKRGGEAIMIEHVRSEGKVLGKAMDLLNPLVRLMGDNINRRTVQNIQGAGLEVLSVEPRGSRILKEIRARQAG